MASHAHDNKLHGPWSHLPTEHNQEGNRNLQRICITLERIEYPYPPSLFEKEMVTMFIDTL
ncbi:hypothetical protein CR513_50066, partial [Mucuna pruriens]